LQAATGYKRSQLWLIDLSDFDSVKSFADRFEQDGGRLDILVENAGISSTTYVFLQISSALPRILWSVD
ncbi:hypothetical protein C8R43DRAFT_872411, partial [Mycena crocata]